MKNGLLTLKTKALLIELLLASAVGTVVIALYGGLTPQSYSNALIVAFIVLAPLELLRQTGMLQTLSTLLSEYWGHAEQQNVVRDFPYSSDISYSAIPSQARAESLTQLRGAFGMLALSEYSFRPKEDRGHNLAVAAMIANQKADILITLQKYDEAKATLQKALALGGEAFEIPNSQRRDKVASHAELVGTYMRLANLADKQGRFAEALDLLNKAEDLNKYIRELLTAQ